MSVCATEGCGRPTVQHHIHCSQCEDRREAREDGRALGQWEAWRAAIQHGAILTCACCGKKPATCIGAYEASVPVLPACDDCCGHGNEDGHCERIADVLTQIDAT